MLRKKYQIHVAGHDIPPALEGFHELETRYPRAKYNRLILFCSVVLCGPSERNVV